MTEHQQNQITIDGEVATMADAIARELGDGWRVLPRRPSDEFPYQHWRELQRADGLGFTLNGGSWSKKDAWHARADGPKNRDGSEERPRQYGDDQSLPSIYFAKTKTAKAAAADIRRRLIAPFESLYATLVERVNATNEYHDTRKGFAGEIAAIVGGTVSTSRYSGGRDQNEPARVVLPSIYRDADHALKGLREIDICGRSRTVDLKVTCGVETLRAIVGLLKAEQATKGA